MIFYAYKLTYLITISDNFGNFRSIHAPYVIE